MRRHRLKVKGVQPALDGRGALAALDAVTGRMIGSSRYHGWDEARSEVEIGWTFVARVWQRTAANPEAKFLLLRHAFETLGLRRVELKTDALNATSRRAIASSAGRRRPASRISAWLPTTLAF